MLHIKKIDHIQIPSSSAPVLVKETGNITQIRYMTRQQEAPIKKISKDYYISLSDETGEVKEFQHKDSRADNPHNVKKSLAMLRDLLNTNVTAPENCRWVTLTYAENMTDTKRLYDDFRKFNMRLRYKLPPYEYIVAMEPQKRGAWHAHAVLIFEKPAPFLDNAVLAGIWGHGFVNVRPLKNVDNIGVYLTAYLGDMELPDALLRGPVKAESVKGVESIDGQGNKRQKAIVKGARLKLYPVGFRLFRYSKGIQRPIVRECTEGEAMQAVDGAKLTYEKAIRLTDESGKVINTISYRHYNRKAKQV